jgi:hypothetical protein
MEESQAREPDIFAYHFPRHGVLHTRIRPYTRSLMSRLEEQNLVSRMRNVRLPRFAVASRAGSSGAAAGNPSVDAQAPGTVTGATAARPDIGRRSPVA